MLPSLGFQQTWPKASDLLLQATISPGKQKLVYIGGELPSPNSIRLLKIHNSTHPEGNIVCTVQAFDLKDKPRYCALSYTWGPAIRPIGSEYELPSPDEPQQILCNDQPLLVTQNLHDALLELRRSGFSDWLWVDAVCIDQSNSEEKASQVSMMGQSYMSCVETIAWLGKDESGVEDMEWAIDVMIPKMLQRAPDFWDIRPLTDFELETIFGIKDLHQRLVSIKTFLASHRWFDRAWVAQEVILAPVLRLQVGRRQISWTNLTNLSIVLSRRTWDKELDFKSAEFDEGYAAAKAFLERLRRLRDLVPHNAACQVSRPASERLEIERILRATFGPETELEVAAAWFTHLLSLVRHLKSSEMHDKIYSMIGVADAFSSKISSLVTPDYDQSPETAYTSTTAALLSNSRYLSILAHVGDLSNTRFAELPSWVVDYSSKTATNPILEFGEGHATTFDASLTSKFPPAPRRIEGTRLTLQGALFDRVTMVSPATLGEVIGDVTHLEDFEKFISCVPNQYFNGRSRTDVIWRVMMMDSEETLKCINHPAPPSFAGGFRAWIINMIELWVAEVVKTGVETESANETARQFFAQLYPNDLVEVPEECQRSEEAFISYHREQMLPFIRAIERKVYGRKLFQTTGNLMGMGSRSIQADDEVWLIRDSKTPLILRPKAGTEDFLLVGEAYLHGFMHGEMLDDVGELEDRIGPVTII